MIERGFTLIELLVVIATIAVANVVRVNPVPRSVYLMAARPTEVATPGLRFERSHPIRHRQLADGLTYRRIDVGVHTGDRRLGWDPLTVCALHI